MPVTKISHAKPLKPYRRGETLGNASRAGKPTGKTTAGRGRKVVPKAVEESEEEAQEESEELEDEEEMESEDDERMAIPAPLLKGRGKKGKTFVESQDALMSLVNSITGSQETNKKAKLSKQRAAPNLPAEARLKEAKLAAKRDQLDAAKAVISAQTRAKKDRRKEREEGNTATSSKTSTEPRKKRVSFA